ncbi:AraC family transcriptional regulator [Catenovulum adriaticum]|uniref:Substrate-binding domain-containing protein n=1 Tax=Catenovulum adriaticum TaxID=2984846 RepID=A0ABY7AVS1_9ALTE|nr:xylose operon transcription regulator XylR [Catenovulum sp. TS8]WAJ72394.1 substrate-binding domain-containing protein [Catenovulum sp. TS8]
MKAPKKILMLLGNYHPATHRGIAKASRDLGWHLNVSMLSPFQIPTHWEGDGIICSLNANQALESFVVQSKIPCVDLSIWRTDLPLPRISGDNDCIGRLAAVHFCENGHQSFGWFCHQQNPVAEARCESFEQELVSRGLKPPAKLIGAATQSYDNIKYWLDTLDKPCALFAYNDNDAAWLLNTCLSAGYRVPHDFSVIGVDNNALICDNMPVPLSSINHDHERIGYEGALLLNRIIGGEKVSPEIQYIQPTGITLRESSNLLAARDLIVKEALEYLLNNLTNPIGTNDVAKYLGVSRRNLEQRFKKHLNTSVHKKLLEFRLKKAENLLRNSNQKIEQIAEETGFCHGPHLCRVFKTAYNQSPLSYRKKHQH